MKPAAVALVALVTVLAGCQAPGVQLPGQSGDGPPDPESDVLGWENGYWYNESIDVDQSDGLNESERDALVSRAMARVEEIRRLEFEKDVPVEVISRSEFRQQRGQQSLSSARRSLDNAKYESLLVINETTDSIAVQNRNTGTAVGGFYSPSEGSIVIVSGNTSSPQVDESTLVHELTHAVQDQQFGLASFNQSTRELHNAKDGLVEGDANYVQYLFEQRCGESGNGGCLLQQRQGDGAGELANIGPYVLKFVPYSDGPTFVKSIRDAKGWQGVNALYENPPTSTEQIIHPELYGKDQPANFSIEDRSNDQWDRLRVDGRPDYASVGEAGIFTMFIYPALATQGEQAVIPGESFTTGAGGGDQNQLDPYNYSHPYSAGWDGDKLAVYVNDQTPPNETGYVMKTVWDSEKDAREFVTAYQQLLELRGATPVEGQQNTWVIPEDREFADAFTVRQQGNTVTVVNAPSVEQLSGVHAMGTSNNSTNARQSIRSA